MLDDGDCGSTFGVWLMPLNCPPKMSTMVSLLDIFPFCHIKKKLKCIKIWNPFKPRALSGMIFFFSTPVFLQ